MITGSESDGDTTGSTKDPTPAQDAPSQDVLVDDSESSEAKAALTSTPAQNLTLDEGKAQAQAAKAASQKRADEGAAAEMRVAPGSPTSEPSIANGEEAITEPQEIENDLEEQQERYQAAQLQGATEVSSSTPPTPVYPRRYYPPDAGSGSPMFLEHLEVPRGLNHGRTSRGAYERALVQSEPLFVNDIEAARCVLLALRRITLKEFTSLRKKPEDLPRAGLPLGTTREHYDPIPGTVHRKAAKKPQTTYDATVASGPRSQQPSGKYRRSRKIHSTSTWGSPLRSWKTGGASHAFEYEDPSQPHTPGPSISDRDSVGSYCKTKSVNFEIAVGLGPGGQAAAQTGKSRASSRCGHSHL
ncbi:Hypothetical protein PHPALM_435 [Phytophthora palmivora]|uniref:Uncharacterized protein n=1 Tax=Phytophthora palmivora TaxID=4796 RepID=A0A2P4YUX9_9STRA|nr:Hypothetical protein PHPALM_435 [Phytophthora palmivora]